MANLLGRLGALRDGQGSLSRADVIAAYRWMLGRDPESEEMIRLQAQKTPGALIHSIVTAPEFHKRWQTSPFYHFHGTLDPEGIIRAHEDKARTAKPGHLVNFLGVAMNVAFMPLVAESGGQVEALPIPANYHAEMGEFGAALRAVDLAKGSFTMIELGCGWGCWMNNTGMAARRRGLDIHLIGVEGDVGHIGFAHEALATNGVPPEAYTLWHGIAGARQGKALFPRQGQAGEHWGLEPKFGLPADEHAKLLASGRFDELPIVALDDVIGDRPRIDLIHMDIQGGEADLVRDCMATLVAKVAYLVIGTHSRAIEGLLMSALVDAGWVLEIERASDFNVTDNGPVTVVDGIQGWRNPTLTKR